MSPSSPSSSSSEPINEDFTEDDPMSMERLTDDEETQQETFVDEDEPVFDDDVQEEETQDVLDQNSPSGDEQEQQDVPMNEDTPEQTSTTILNDSSKNVKKVGTSKTKKKEPAQESERISRKSLFPVSRVQRIIKADKDLPTVGKDAVFLISLATEEFIGRIAAAAQREASRENRMTVQHKDLATVVHRIDEFLFLGEIMPWIALELAELKKKEKEKEKAKKSAAKDVTEVPKDRDVEMEESNTLS